MRIRFAAITVVLAALLCVAPHRARAQIVPAVGDRTGAALALPIVTDGDDGTSSTITISNSGEAVELVLHFLSGDPEDAWSSEDFRCGLDANATALLTFSASGDGTGSRLAGTCAPDGIETAAANGILFVTLADPETGASVNANRIFGRAVVTTPGAGRAWAVEALAFPGRSSSEGVGDRIHRFDDSEYAAPPSQLAATFLAPDENVDALLILFTFDGRPGGGTPSEAHVSIDVFASDATSFATALDFNSFVMVELTDLDAGFAADQLGSTAGHMKLTPESVFFSDIAHDTAYDSGQGAIPGIRKPPVMGWLVQRNSAAAWGRPLQRSAVPLAPSDGDAAVLDLRTSLSLPEPSRGALELASVLAVAWLSLRGGRASARERRSQMPEKRKEETASLALAPRSR